MSDEQVPGPRTQEAEPAAPEVEPAVPSKKKPLWPWIVGAVVVVVLLFGAYAATQTEQGNLWLLGLRGMAAVPQVIGQTQPQAQATLQAAGLRLGQVSEEATLAVPPGTVIGQSPSAGGTAKKDSAVDVSVASIPTAAVPNVIGQTQSDAVTLLAEEGLRTGTITYVYDSNTAAGNVTAQQPSASTEASVGSAVELTVSKGTQQGQVPNVVGLSQDDANSVITAAGFKVKIVKATSTSVPAGDVVSQSPAAGVVTAAGSTVTITVSTGAPAPQAAAPAPSAPATTPETPSTPSTPPPTSPSEPTKPGTKPSQPIATTVEVPDVIGNSVRDAVKALRDATLRVSFAFAPTDKDVLKIIKQAPESGATVDPGSTVVITIGLPSFSLPEGKPTQPTPLPAEPAQQPATQPAPQPSTQPAQPTAPSQSTQQQPSKPQPSAPTTP